jgi:glutamyl-tRNA(Gln) amidotransferase subunit D
MATEKELSIGDRISLRTKDKSWDGMVLESYTPEILLLKLDSGYNIGIRERDVLEIKVLKESEKNKKQEIKLEKKPNLRNVAMIITGGTISSRLDPKTGGVISTDAEEILNIAPEIKDICNIVKIEKPFMKWSENMTFLDWKNLAKKAENLLNQKEIDGIIISHGTDFLHYTSAALSFFLGKLNKPVALTYSQRSIDRGSSDAHLNLVCAAKYAVSDIAEVAIIGHKDLNDEVCLAMPGTKTRKLHTSRRDAFRVVNSDPFAEISKKDFKILREFNARSENKIETNVQYTDKVAIVKIYPGQDPEILDFYENKGYKGIILEVAGIGQVPGKGASAFNWLPRIKKTIEKGVVVCACAQTIYGRLNPKVYENGRELEKTGIVFLKDMLSETAFVKISWLLGQKSLLKKPDEIRKRMLENISGEFSESLGFE